MKKTIFLLLMFTFSNVIAEQTPMSNYRDGRLKVFVYSEDEIFHLHTHFGLSTKVSLAPYEKIDLQTVVIGHSGIFHFHPRKHGFTLTPRTLAPKQITETNLVFDTNLRSYTFKLYLPKYLKNKNNANYGVKFEYPGDDLKFAMEKAAKLKAEEAKENIKLARKEKTQANLKNCENINLENINYDYEAEGSEELRPYDMFDDGVFTYIKPNKQASITTLNKNNRERNVNSHPGCGYTIVEGVYRKLILTVDDGEKREVTCITNHSFNKNKPKSNVKFSG